MILENTPTPPVRPHLPLTQHVDKALVARRSGAGLLCLRLRFRRSAALLAATDACFQLGNRGVALGDLVIAFAQLFQRAHKPYELQVDTDVREAISVFDQLLWTPLGLAVANK